MLILPTRGAVKAHCGRYRPTARADATLPPGIGATDEYGNYHYERGPDGGSRRHVVVASVVYWLHVESVPTP